MRVGPLQIQRVDPDPIVEELEDGVRWSGIEELVVDLGPAHWYGHGTLIHQQWPLEKLAQYEAPFLTSDNGPTGLLGTLHPFWFNSDGGGILVESPDDIVVGWNSPLEGEAHERSVHASRGGPFDQRPRLSEGIETTEQLRIRGTSMTVRLFHRSNPREVMESFWTTLEFPPDPPTFLFERPLWTTWAHLKNDIDHRKILGLVDEMSTHGFQASVLGIDAKWQTQFGDTTFDPEKFPNAEDFVKELKARGIDRVTLWCVPFFTEASEHFEKAGRLEFALKDEEGRTFIGDWWEGQASFLDITDPEAMRWHLDNLDGLLESVGADGFKFDAGEALFYDQPGITTRNHAGNRATTSYLTHNSSRHPWSDIRCAWKTQTLPILTRQWDKTTDWTLANGLPSCITGAMTLNVLGYPLNFPDMIGGNQYRERILTEELMIRWTQALAPMPFVQFSIPPWKFGSNCVELCRRAMDLHHDLSGMHIARWRKRKPLVMPLWWDDPTSPEAQACDDQYLIGDRILVAPVMTEGAATRDVYLPPGSWMEYHDHDRVHEGGGWLRDVPAPLPTLPLFIRKGRG